MAPSTGHDRAPKRISYGRAPFKLAGGSTATVHVALNGAGRKLVSKRHRAAVVWLNVRFVSGGGSRSTRLMLHLAG